MKEYDFHALLDDVEFEALAVDVIRVREDLEPNEFRRYPRGKDGGIDGYKYSDGTVIQAKKYKNDYNVLLRSLKKEVLKLHNLQPPRYILVTSVALTKNNQEEILDLFKGYIHSEKDIIGKVELNDYLLDPKFSAIEYKYQNLWMPSTAIFEHLLQNNILRAENNFNQFYLTEMKNNVCYYIKTKAYYKSLEIIDLNNCLLIYGEPGIGKTMLGYNIAFHYLMQDKDMDLFFTDTIEDVYKFYRPEKKQLFVVDDFLGVNYVNSKIKNGESKIYRMLNGIIGGNNHKIILISRKNILYEGMKLIQELKAILQNMSVELSSTILEDSDKTRILWSILRKSNLKYSQLHDVVMFSNRVVKSENFNPRLLNDTIHHISNCKDENVQAGQKLLRALANPDEVYELMYNHLNEISESAIYLGSCIAIFEHPVELNILRKCYGELQEKLPWRKWQSFDDALDQLSYSFCFVRDITFTQILSYMDFDVKITIVGFNNHSILGYWRNKIAKNLSLFGLNIIKNVDLMNSILFFSDKLLLMKLIDEHNNMEYMQKVIPEIIDKIAKDYERLDFIYLNGFEYQHEDYRFTDFYLSSDYTNSYIIKLRRILDLNEQFNSEKLRVVIAELKTYFINCLLKDDRHSLSDEEKYSVPEIVNKLIKQGFKIPDMKEILDSYRSKINFLKFYIVFYEFRDIYGEGFDDYLQKNNNAISKNLIWMIHDDYEHFMSDGLEFEIEQLLFDDISRVLEIYGVKVKNDLLKSIRKLERELNSDGYNVKWNRELSCFESATDKESNSNSNNPDFYEEDDNVEYFEDDFANYFIEVNSLKELLPYVPSHSSDWNELINVVGITNFEDNIIDEVYEDLFNGGSQWRGTYEMEPLFLAKIIEEYKHGNRIEGRISRFLGQMLSSIETDEFELLTKIAVSAQEHNERYFNRSNLKQWINFSNDEWDMCQKSDFLGYSNGWMYFISPEIHIYLLSQNINQYPHNKSKILNLSNWIFDDLELQSSFIYNLFVILIEFFEEECSEYFLSKIQPFIEKMKILNGTDQLAYGLFSVYESQEMSNRQEVDTEINDWVLLRFLEMLEVSFIEVTSDLSYELFQMIATTKTESESTINYEYCLAHSEKLAPLLNSSVEQIIEDDLIKIDDFIKKFFSLV
ncbi:nSTAND3 domain-containing NTPase [Paenibacillus medicaginis]|uniref:Novel STAND NTPase 3 domain-containing protein n=1 Tax=Paenibacillus medicaginis TaxID=1470560 RepID=A0ABV5C1M3_9BACL